MQGIDQPIWQLILKAAEHLSARVGDFRLDEIIKEVQRFNPRLERTSIQPVVQGMTSNAGKGPSSPCGRPLVRISHGVYRLSGEVQEVEPRSTSKPRSADPIVRSQTTSIRSMRYSVEQIDTERVVADIVLVSCVKTKRPEAAAAKDLYTSALFRKGRSYAEGSGVPWYILSAEHGLITPDKWLAPYERYLPEESSSYREEWGVNVVSDLENVEGSMQGKVIEIHAGAVYLDAIRSGLQSRGAIIVEPLRGLPMGKRLQWYDRILTRQPGVKRVANEPLADIESLVASLSDDSLAVSPSDFLASGSAGRKLPGLYSWWVDAEGAQELTGGLGHRITTGLIYAGLAGATHWPSGKRSSNTLWLRIATMHLGTNHEFSTFRRTIGAILASAEGRDYVDEVALTGWMELHLRVQVVPYEDADSLGKVEQAILAELDPPLNLKGMPDSVLRRQLKNHRRAVTRPKV